MKAESLKQLAEYMGKRDVSIISGEVRYAQDGWEEKAWYRPHTTNAEQCLELMEKLNIDVYPQSNQIVGKPETRKDYWVAGQRHFDKKGEFVRVLEEGKTINEAVTLAAIAAIKE